MNMKNNLKIVIFLGVAIALGISLANSTTGTKKVAKMPIPIANGWYTLGGLFDLINTNNPSKNSNFLVLVNGSTQSASVAGLSTQYIIANRAAMVQLLADEDRINQLTSAGSLTTITKPYYQRLLLYFKLPNSTYKFYLNDPTPGKVVNTARGTTNPALNIINKWDFTKYIPSMR